VWGRRVSLVFNDSAWVFIVVLRELLIISPMCSTGRHVECGECVHVLCVCVHVCCVWVCVVCVCIVCVHVLYVHVYAQS